jgi:hypothetical protein
MERFFESLIAATRIGIAESSEGLVEIRVHDDLPDNIDLSSLIRNALFVIDNNIEERSDLRIQVIISGNFGHLEIDNDFPSKTSFHFCYGKSIHIRRNGSSSEAEKKSSLHFFSASLTDLRIQDSIDVFDSEHLTVTNFTIHNDDDNPVSFELLEIHGSVNELAIRNAATKRAVFDLLNTIGQQAVINVQLFYFNPKYFYFQSRQNINLFCEGGKAPKFILRLHTNARKIRIEEIECENFVLEQRLGTIQELTFRRVIGLKALTLTGRFDDGQLNRIEKLYLNTLVFNKDFGGVIEYFKVKHFAIYDVVSQGLMRLTDVDLTDADFRIGKSRLGNFTFFNSKLPGKITVLSSSIEEIRFAGTPPPTRFLTGNNEKSAFSLDNEIQTLQQMKTVMEKMGDKDMSKFFRGEELKLRHKRVKINSVQEFEEKATLWFNFSNNHGQTWLKPLAIALLGTGPIIFSLFLFSIGYEIHLSWNAAKMGLNLWSHYFEVIVPSYLYPSKNKLAFLENFNSRSEKELWQLPLASQLLILLNDILIMPYLIIQTVTAFRKHVA